MATVSLNQMSKLGKGKFSAGFGGSAVLKTGVFIRGDKQLITKLNKLNKNVPRVTLDAMTRVLLIVEAEAVRLVTSGYYRPAIDTGHMRRSITHRITNFNPGIIEGVVGLNVFYAIYVHEGTIYMEKRPFLTDALKNKQAVIQAIFVDTLRRGLKT